MNNPRDPSLHNSDIDKKEKDTREWFQKYSQTDASDITRNCDVLKAVGNDELYSDVVKQKIHQAGAEVTQTPKGFYVKCQDLFDNWPTLGYLSKREWELGPGKEHERVTATATFEMESAARRGRRFCRFLLQVITDSRRLDIIRKIEIRLHYLGEFGMPSLGIQNEREKPLLKTFEYANVLEAHTTCGYDPFS